MQLFNLAREPREIAFDAVPRTSMWLARLGGWRDQLRRRIDDGATAMIDAVAHATGVYFPKRAHAARIAIATRLRAHFQQHRQ